MLILEKYDNLLSSSIEFDDKSKFLNSLGYNLSNRQELEKAIIKGVDFSKNKIIKFNEFGLFFNSEIKIFNQKNCKYYCLTAGWKVENNNNIKFITLIPKKYKDE